MAFWNFRNNVTRKRNLCQMAEGRRTYRMEGTPTWRYLYDDDGTTRFGGAGTYNLRTRSYRRGTFGRRWSARARSSSGRDECVSGCAPLAKTEIVGDGLPEQPKTEKQESPVGPGLGQECDSTSPGSTNSEELKCLVDPDNTVVELTDSSGGESPQYNEETKKLLKEMFQSQVESQARHQQSEQSQTGCPSEPQPRTSPLFHQ